MLRFNFSKSNINKILIATAIVFVYALLVLIKVTKTIHSPDVVIRTDIQTANLLFFLRNTEFTKFFFFITALGNWQTIIIFTLIVCVILWRIKKRIYIAPFLLSVGGSEISTLLWKIIFHRPRPELAEFLEKTFSFPSGHSTIAVSFYGFIIYILWRNAKTRLYKIIIPIIGALLIFTIGFSRLYLGVHFLSDVIAGYLLGIFWVIIGIGLLEFLKKRERKKVRK